MNKTHTDLKLPVNDNQIIERSGNNHISSNPGSRSSSWAGLACFLLPEGGFPRTLS